MLLNLVKKDSLLVKKYLILMFIAAIALPVFIKMKTGFLTDGGVLAFFLSTLFIQFLIFNSVSMIEYKYKGSALLCATPYRRNALVLSKYLFLFLIFIGCCILYTATALLIPKQLDLLSFSDLGSSFLILSVIFSVMIPVQYRFGFEKAKFIFFFSIFITPFIAPVIVEYVQSHNIRFQMVPPTSPIIQPLLSVLLALAIGAGSVLTSVRIYEKQNL